MLVNAKGLLPKDKTVVFWVTEDYKVLRKYWIILGYMSLKMLHIMLIITKVKGHLLILIQLFKAFL